MTHRPRLWMAPLVGLLLAAAAGASAFDLFRDSAAALAAVGLVVSELGAWHSTRARRFVR